MKNFILGILLASLSAMADTPPIIYQFAAPLVKTGGKNVSIPKADSTHDGYLSSSDWSIFSGASTGPSGTVTGYDHSGNIYGIPGWQITTENALQQSESMDMVANNFDQFIGDVQPTANTSGIYRTQMLFQSQLDNGNTKLDIGNPSNPSNPGGVTLITANIQRQTGGNTGNVSVINGYSNWGNGTDAGILNQYSDFAHGEKFLSGMTINSYQGVGVFPIFDHGSTLVSANIFQQNAQFNGISTGYVEGLSMYNSFGASSVTAHYHSLDSGADGNTTANISEYVGINNYINNAHIGSLTGIQFTPGNLVVTNGATLARFSISNSTMGDDSTYLQVGGNTGNVMASGKSVTGINVDLSGTSSDQQKNGLNVNDGSTQLQSNWDTAILMPSGEFQQNLIGGNFKISPGFPITNGSFGFGNNMGPGLDLEDSMGPDATGVGIGFAVNGLVNQIGVADGATIDTVNYMLVGGGAIPVTGTVTGSGVITNLNLVNTIGFLPEGSPLFNITNLSAYHAGGLLCILANNCWGVKIDNTSADNWFAKDVVIGGSTGKPTVSGVALDVTGPAKFSDVLQLPVQPLTNTPTCATSADDGKLAITNTHILCVCNGNTHGWFNASDGITACTF